VQQGSGQATFRPRRLDRLHFAVLALGAARKTDRVTAAGIGKRSTLTPHDRKRVKGEQNEDQTGSQKKYLSLHKSSLHEFNFKQSLLMSASCQGWNATIIVSSGRNRPARIRAAPRQERKEAGFKDFDGFDNAVKTTLLVHQSKQRSKVRA
jgi:hypothetical protein